MTCLLTQEQLSSLTSELLQVVFKEGEDRRERAGHMSAPALPHAVQGTAHAKDWRDCSVGIGHVPGTLRYTIVGQEFIPCTGDLFPS